MEGEHRNFDGKTNEHSRKNPHLSVLGNRTAIFDKVGNGETFCPGFEEQCKERNQHQCRAKHRVQKELERCVLAVLATPHTNHEVHRQENKFKEDKEQNQVLRNKGSGHTRLQNKHQHEECFWIPW